MNNVLKEKLARVIVDIDNVKKSIIEVENEKILLDAKIESKNETIKEYEKMKKTLEKQLGIGVEPPKPKRSRFSRRSGHTEIIFMVCVMVVIFTAVAWASSSPKIKCAYDASNNVEYIGYGTPGTSEDLTPTGFFQIRKCTYDANNNLTDVKWADGNDNFDNSWINRENLKYE